MPPAPGTAEQPTGPRLPMFSPLNATSTPAHASSFRGLKAIITKFLAAAVLSATATAQAPEQPWLYAKARALPKILTNQGSGYFAIVEGKNGCLYIGTAKYGESAYLVEYDPVTQQM